MDNNTVTLIFSGIVTLSTVVYSILTWFLVTETRKMRKNAIEPYIVCFLDNTELDAKIVYLNCKNIGEGVALNLRFDIIKELDYSNARRLEQYAYFREGVKYFPPGNLDKHLLTVFNSADESLANDSLILGVQYQTILGERRNHRYELSLSELTGKGNLVPPKTHIGNIGHQLEKIENHMKKLAYRLEESQKDS